MSDHERRKSGTLPGAPPPPRANTPAPPGIPVVAPYADKAARSEPIRVISMKEPSEPVRMPERPPPKVKLRAIAELAKPPPPQGRLAPPRDGREARARQQRKNVLWVLGGLVLAVAIAATVWLVAGR